MATTILHLPSGAASRVNEDPRAALLRAFAASRGNQDEQSWEAAYGPQIQQCSLGTLVLGDFAARRAPEGTILARGGYGRALLPSYSLHIRALDPLLDRIEQGDLVLVAGDPLDYHAWTRVDPVHVGKSPLGVFGIVSVLVGRLVPSAEEATGE